MLTIALALVVLTLAVFAQVSRHDFINFDDADYVLQNSAVARGLTSQGVRWALTSGDAGNWHPVTWVSHMADVEWFGLDAGKHHLMSVALHALTTALLFWVLAVMTAAPGRSAFVAALFAIHPLHVESVAWIAERKDVLSTLLWTLAICAYVAWVRRPRAWRYGTLLAVYALALMAKPMVVTLPFVLLLLDIWPLGRFGEPGRWRRLVIEKAPLLAMAAAASVITFVVQQQAGAVKTLEAFPLARRAANALVSYVEYIAMTIWPAGLAAIYPYPASVPVWQVIGAALALIAATVLAIRSARTRPYLLVGWLWFLGTLVPVIGLVQVGSQPIADRYMYVPAIGLFIIAAWGGWELLSRWSERRATIAIGVAAVMVVAFAVVAHRQAGRWSDSVTLWQHAVAATGENHRARTNLGHALAERQRLDEAVVQYREALRINPDFAEAYNYLGVALADKGDYPNAVAQYAQALRVLPGFADARNNLGLSFAAQGKMNEAVAEFREAVRLQPVFAPARNNLAIALAGQGRLDDAIAEFTESLRLQPDNGQSHVNLAIALADRGRQSDAVPHFLEAIRLGSGDARAHHRLGVSLAELGRLDESLQALQVAIQLQPTEPDFIHDAGAVLARKGLITEAVQAMRAALKLDPQHAGAREALATLTKAK